ncbi:family 43 glycosylhydrolase [Streptomyces umbrinus]|uniref:family 43 glycosylhydrolase n=1 Tax=Streptomyces umbrinus TaxID=67370 RepID=UPI00167B620B|nr:family 43 glycosylhydrolase [Streptomyces umbrinus]
MTSSERTFCNPLDISYRYQDIRFSGTVQGIKLGEPRRSVHREAADPSIVRYRDRYYMFVSMSAGFWHSADLVRWEYHATSKLPALDYAPDVREIDEALYISASRKEDNCPFFRSVDPLSDDFVEVTPGTFPFWDPNLFQDTDRSVYLYWGCDSKTPLYGVRLSDTFSPIGEPSPLISADVLAHGWEQLGEDHVVEPPQTERDTLIARLRGTTPYIEGAWMTERNGTYYLQYAAPATQLNTYADGYYTATSPLGPFTYSLDSPFSSKPGGFITGAGHGSTFQDEHGNWWHAATMRISVNDEFERRVGIFPAGFDDDGVLFCNQNFADYPMTVPDGPFDPWTPPAWMLLSYKADAVASSAAPGHDPASAVDEDVRTWWAAANSEPSESLTVDLGAGKTVHALQINLADHELADGAPHTPEGVDLGHSWRGIFPGHQPAEFVVEISPDGQEWTVVRDSRGTGIDAPHGYLVLDAPCRTRFVRVTSGRLPFDGVFAVSGVRVFGTGDGDAPPPVRARAARVDDRTARIEWDAAPGAIGYNIRYGRHPRKLYHSWLVHERTALDLRSLNAGVEYWVAVDAFGEAGVTSGEPVSAAWPERAPEHDHIQPPVRRSRSGPR